MSFADPSLKPMRVVDPALRGFPIGDNDATRVLGSTAGVLIFGAAGTAGVVGTGIRAGAEILGTGGAGIASGKVGAVGAAKGRI